MGRFDKNEPKLNEVKAVLQRLQGFPEDEPTVVTARPPRSATATARSRSGVGGVVVIAASVVLVGAVIGVTLVLSNHSTPEPRSLPKVTVKSPEVTVKGPAPDAVKPPPVTVKPPPVAVEPPPVPPESVRVASLDAARALMAQGHVRAARQQLLALAAKGSPDAAWDVARSYDPNVLATIPEADAAPDVPEATRWYRAWYEKAVKEGMVANSVNVERIIGAMPH